jgi:hypothetical protein
MSDSESDTEYDIEAIVGEKEDEYGRKLYEVKWKGYDSSENSFENANEYDRNHSKFVLDYK